MMSDHDEAPLSQLAEILGRRYLNEAPVLIVTAEDVITDGEERKTRCTTVAGSWRVNASMGEAFARHAVESVLNGMIEEACDCRPCNERIARLRAASAALSVLGVPFPEARH